MNIFQKVLVVFDFDFTIVPHESLVEVLNISLSEAKDHKALDYLNNPGKLKNDLSAIRKIAFMLRCLFSITRRDVQIYIRNVHNSIDKRILDLIKTINGECAEVFILSNAYKDWLVPAASYLGIAPEYVYGNRLIWLFGRAVGIRPSKLLSGHQGKSYFVKQLIEKRPKGTTVIVVGDGTADFNVYENRLADIFIQAKYYQSTTFCASDPNLKWSHADDINQLISLIKFYIENHK
ncbi:MAG: haloacid dehalogenase-like hydrolase [Bacteroidota bacterium]